MLDYYVYEHIRNDNNTVFYVGKGHKDRAYKSKRNEHHNRIAEKYGFTVNIVKDRLSEEEAYNLEREIIYDYVFNKGYGIDIEGLRKPNSPYQLVNHTLGGDGSYGMVHTQEWCEQHSKDMIGEKNPMYGINVWESYNEEKKQEIKEKISQHSLGINNSMYGISPSERMDSAQYKIWREKLVNRMKNQTGDKNPNWHNNTLHNKVKDNPELRIQYYSRPGSQNGRCRKIELYDLEENYINTFDYIGECAEYVKEKSNARGKINSIRSNIVKYAKNNKPFLGYKYKII